MGDDGGCKLCWHSGEHCQTGLNYNPAALTWLRAMNYSSSLHLHPALILPSCSICAPWRSEWLADGRLAAPPRQTGVIKTALLNGSSNGCNLFVTAEQVLLKINHPRKRQTVLRGIWKRFGLAAVTEGSRPCLISYDFKDKEGCEISSSYATSQPSCVDGELANGLLAFYFRMLQVRLKPASSTWAPWHLFAALKG